MVFQLLVSGVQYHQCGRMELAGASQFTVECFPGTLEEQAVKLAAVTEYQCRKFVRQCEDDLKVRHARQEDFARFF